MVSCSVPHRISKMYMFLVYKVKQYYLSAFEMLLTPITSKISCLNKDLRNGSTGKYENISWFSYLFPERETVNHYHITYNYRDMEYCIFINTFADQVSSFVSNYKEQLTKKITERTLTKKILKKHKCYQGTELVEVGNLFNKYTWTEQFGDIKISHILLANNYFCDTIHIGSQSYPIEEVRLSDLLK